MGAVNTFVNTLIAGQNLAPVPITPDKSRLSRVVKKACSNGLTTVGRLLNNIHPSGTPLMLLGQCQDGLPLLIELDDPELGAILVSCEKGMGKTHQLQVLADSASRLNAPSKVQLGVVTFKPGEWQGWQTFPQLKKYLQGMYAWYDPGAESLINSLVDLAEARREGQRLGAEVLFILDDLTFVEELSFNAQVNLHWLLEYGSQSGVWVVAAINAHQGEDFRYWLDPFRTRLIGKVISDANADALMIRSTPHATVMEPAMFGTWIGDDWRTYRLPLLGD